MWRYVPSVINSTASFSCEKWTGPACAEIAMCRSCTITPAFSIAAVCAAKVTTAGTTGGADANAPPPSDRKLSRQRNARARIQRVVLRAPSTRSYRARPISWHLNVQGDVDGLADHRIQARFGHPEGVPVDLTDRMVAWVLLRTAHGYRQHLRLTHAVHREDAGHRKAGRRGNNRRTRKRPRREELGIKPIRTLQRGIAVRFVGLQACRIERCLYLVGYRRPRREIDRSARDRHRAGHALDKHVLHRKRSRRFRR